jgi:glycosyltransferase involved in cell wall biosynthesis
MRVGLVIYGNLATLSGGYLYDRKLLVELQRLRCVVDVISLPWRDYAKHLGDNVNAAWQRQLAKTPVDLWLQDELNHPSLLLANFSRRRRQQQGQPQAPVVSVVHHLRSSELEHPAPLRRIYRRLEQIYVNSVDALLYNSHTTRSTVEALLSRPKPWCVALPAADHLAPGSADTAVAILAQRTRQPGPLRVLFVGNLIRRKGLHLLLDALQTLPAELWRLDIVGRTDIDYGYTKEIAARLHGLPPGNVTLLGKLSDADLTAAYQSHQLLAVPSYEGFGIVYLEAMRFGLPVIASTAGAAREIVTPGENGYLVGRDAAAAMAHHVRQLALNRELLLAMSCGARQRYLQHPTWQQSLGPAASWLTTLPTTIYRQSQPPSSP